MSVGDEPIVLRPGEGRQFRFGRRSMIVKADKDNPAFALFETEPPPGVWAAVPHRHRDHSEAFYVLTGEVEFRLGERTERCPAGAFVFVPRGAVHGFRNPGPGPAKMLAFVAPADGLGVVEELGAVTPADGAPDPEQVWAIFAKYHTELMIAP